MAITAAEPLTAQPVDYGPTETALRIGVSVPTLWRMRKRGEGPRSYLIGRERRYLREDVERFISLRRASAA